MPLVNPGRKAMDQEILRIHQLLATLDPSSDEYQTQLKTLEKLDSMKAPTRRKPASYDQVISSGFGLALGVLVVAWESKHVWLSKVPLNFPGKSKG